MRAILGFVVLLAGVGAVAAHLSEPRRFTTDMTPLTAETSRLGAFAAVADDAPPPATAVRDTTAFETTMTPGVQTSAAHAPAEIGGNVAAPVVAGSDLDAATRDALARDIQVELARLGCYAGPTDGVWSPEARRGAGAFVAKANARIPVTEPDFALFSLAKTATADQACGPAITVAHKPTIERPAMGLGGPGQRKPARETAYRSNDKSVQSLFTNPLGR
jgi:hypothetical protein